MKCWLLLFMLPLLLNGEITWQADVQKPFKATITLQSQHMTLGESVHLEAEFYYPSSYQFNIHSLVDQLTWTANPLAPQWSLLEFKISDLPAEDNMQAQRLNVNMSPLMEGQLTASFLTITFLPKEATQPPVHLFTPLFSFEVLQPPSSMAPVSLAPLLPLDSQFPLELTQANRALFLDHPKRLEETKEFVSRYLKEHSFPWLTLVTLLGSAGIGWVIYLTRDRWPKRSSKSAASLTPKQQIDQALQDLQKREIANEQTQMYYVDLASVLLKSLQVQLGWKTQELTTAELVQAMRKQPKLSSQQTEEIISILTEFDQVKFAGKKPAQTETAQMYQKVQKLIQQLFIENKH